MDRHLRSRQTFLSVAHFIIDGALVAAVEKPNIPDDKLALYDKLIATLPAVERRGAANPYTSLNGNMFSLLLGPAGTMALRLPQDERDKFLKKHKTKLYQAYGAVMKEYVTVPDALLKDTKTLHKYLAISYEYVRTLKPKATKKKR
jgi:TfoX/Sxy family transcriptional regulator of competence genes